MDPLDPEGSTLAIELIGHGAQLFAVNMGSVPEFFLDIRPYGHEAGYEASPPSSATLSSQS